MRSTKIKYFFIIFITLILTFSNLLTKTEAVTGLTVFTPVETSTILNNPFMGWAPWANGGPYQQPHRLVYINVSWADLEPEKGKYDFDSLEWENKFSYWESKGVKIIFRLNMDYPSSKDHIDIPQWLYDEIGGDGTKYDLPYGKGFSPNYANPKLISYHKLLIDALAARYNTDDLIPMIAIGSLGHWGEFHTWKNKRFTIPFPVEEISDQYVMHYIKAFTNKTLLMRRPFELAKNNGMGLYNDSFGNSHQTYDLFLDNINNGYTDLFTGEAHPAMPEFWKAAPSGGEFADYPGLKYLTDSTIDKTIQQIRDTHVSWLGPSLPAYRPKDTSLQRNLDLILNTMGYRFVLRSAKYKSAVTRGRNLKVEMEWENKGVAPFYYKWPLELSLSDAKGTVVAKTLSTADIRTWLPGKTKTTQILKIPKGIKAGKYDICVAIIDPAANKPGIDLAIKGKRPDGRYKLSSVSIR